MALPSVLLSQSERNTGKALNHLNLDVMVMPIIDQRHALLLHEVCNRDIIDQATFAALAQKHGLFPAGAIETINEWAFDRFEEPVLDEGEPIEIAHHLIRSSRTAMSEQSV